MRKFLCLLALISLSVSLFSQEIAYYNGQKVVAKMVIFKYRSSTLKSAPAQESQSKVELLSYLHTIGATTPIQKFPYSKMPKHCDNCVDISQIHSFTYSSNVSLEKVISQLSKFDCIAYAEPSYISEFLGVVPNDTEFEKGNLWHLNTCKVLDAWEIEEGDSTVVIGIVDGGIDISHDDLIKRIAYNEDDPINGKDDDGDGFVDNFRGWDVASDDNNPSSSGTEHGTYVAGIASAEVNNNFCTAGVGYKTKFLPIKVCKDNSSNITNGYEGIAYAANHGCSVINCSWGDPSYSEYGKDMVDYATFNCNALVVASAGNSASKTLFYPASYPNVFSVGGTIVGDYVWDDPQLQQGTQYNHYVDVCAPAKGYYSIANNNKVIAMSGGGTSFSAPIVSGVAALIKSKYPEYSAMQISELIRVTCDNIYDLNSEEIYQDNLGSGRVNAYKALTNTTLPGIRITDSRYQLSNNKIIVLAGETFDVYLTLKNYLHTAQNITATISSDETFATIQENTVTIPTFNSDETQELKFSFEAIKDIPYSYSLEIKLVLDGENDYHEYEYFSISFNPPYYDFSIGNIKSTATNRGTLGFYPLKNTEQQINGFQYKNNKNSIFQAWLAMIDDTGHVYSYQKNNIIPGQFPTVVEQDSCDLMLYSDYDFGPLFVHQFLYGWEDTDALFYEYSLKNKSDSTLSNVRFGLFFDWDLDPANYNKIWYVDSLRLTIVSSANPKTNYVGWMPLDLTKDDLYAFLPNIDSVVNYNNGFSDDEFLFAMSNRQTSVGTDKVSGVDVAVINYSTLDSIPSQDSVSVRYAMLAADTEEELYALASKLKEKYIPPVIIDTTVAVSNLTKPNVRIAQDESSYVLHFDNCEQAFVQLYSVSGKLLEYANVGKNNVTYRIKTKQTGTFVVIVNQNGEMYHFKIVNK